MTTSRPKPERQLNPDAEIGYSYIHFSNPEQEGGDSIRRLTADAAECRPRNGLQLDTSTMPSSKGQSVFRGGHRANPEVHALARFLDEAKRSRIRHGRCIDYLETRFVKKIRNAPAIPLLPKEVWNG